MNEWKKVSEELPPLKTTVWGGWFDVGGKFISGLFVLANNGNFQSWASKDDYPVSHWMYLPKPPENRE